MNKQEFLNIIKNCISGSDEDISEILSNIAGGYDEISEDDFLNKDIDISNFIENLKQYNHLYVLSTMWCDNCGDSTSYIAGSSNLKIDTTEFDQATNMSSSTHVITKIDSSKKGYVLVYGRNGEDEGCYILYICN